MSGYRDIHAHFLYGVDDGAKTKADMEAMLDAAHADGVTALVATPHATPGVYPLDHELVRERLEEAQAYCRSREYPMTLYAGAELMYTPALDRFAQEGRLPTLAGSGDVLLEFAPDVVYEELEAAVGMLERAGYQVILAHIERYGCLYRRKNAYRLKQQHPVRYQMNCSTILNGRGWLKDRQIQKWLAEEIIDFVATDSHDVSKRPTQMRAAHAALCQRCGEAYADRLVGDPQSSVSK